MCIICVTHTRYNQVHQLSGLLVIDHLHLWHQILLNSLADATATKDRWHTEMHLLANFEASILISVKCQL
jgi:hypothetical protein